MNYHIETEDKMKDKKFKSMMRERERVFKSCFDVNICIQNHNQKRIIQEMNSCFSCTNTQVCCRKEMNEII